MSAVAHPPIRSRIERRRILAILALCGFAYSLLPLAIAPLVPVVEREFGVSPLRAAWLLAGYQLAAGFAAPLLGRWGDAVGRVRMLTVVLAIFAAGTLVCATTQVLGLLIAGRIVQGVGESIFPLAFGIIRDEFPPEDVGHAIGITSATIGVGSVTGLFLGVLVLDRFDYRWLFWIALVPVLTALVATVLGLPEAPRSDRPTRRVAPVRDRGVRLAHVVAFLAGFGMFAQLVVVPQLLQAPSGRGFGLDLSAAGSALFLVPSCIGMILGSPASGWLARRFGPRMPLLAGIAFAAVGYLELLVLHVAPWHVALNSLIIGLGLGLSFAGIATVLVGLVSPARVGAATGVNAIMRNLGGAASAQVIAVILASRAAADGWPDSTGFVLAILAAGGALVAALVVGSRIPRGTAWRALRAPG